MCEWVLTFYTLIRGSHDKDDCASTIMANATSQITFTKIINLSKGDRDIKKLMNTLGEHGVGRDTHQLIPIFTELKFVNRIHDKNIETVRRFLKALRPFQLSHYMRFICDLDLLMESDCADIMYTRDDRVESHKDVTFIIHNLSPNHFEIRVRVHPISRMHLNIRELSRMTYPTIFGLTKDMDEDAIHLEMIKFHRNNRFSEISHVCKEPIHVLFIPSGSHGGCYTIPLFGLSHQDAIRRSVFTDREFASLKDAHPDFVCEIVFTQQLAQMLVASIVDNEKSGPRSVISAQTYALAEILFGYYLRTRQESTNKDHVDNNFIWFETIQDGAESFLESYAVHIKHTEL